MARTRSQSGRRANKTAAGGAAAEPEYVEPAIKEGSLYFHFRQKFGLVVACSAIVFMLHFYKSMPETAVYGGFGILLVGWAIHEARPFKRLENIRAEVEAKKNA